MTESTDQQVQTNREIRSLERANHLDFGIPFANAREADVNAFAQRVREMKRLEPVIFEHDFITILFKRGFDKDSEAAVWLKPPIQGRVRRFDP
jgi:hypothetical protein